MRNLVPALLLPLLLLAACSTCKPGCRSRCRPCENVVVKTPVPTPAPRQQALYDGTSGRPTTLDAFVEGSRGASLIAFGELHSHPVGARMEYDLLRQLWRQDPRLALAMEFFETDTQADLDAYLAGELDKLAFAERTRRQADYDKTHGPLVEWCRLNKVPVIAANAPRRLVREYRRSEDEYGDFLESLEEEDRALLPLETNVLDDPYWEKFSAMMGGMKAESFFKAQALWDDAMAAKAAAFVDANPDHRVLLIVGTFHVDEKLGTITKYRMRRPGDEVRTLVMRMDDDPTLPFADEDQGAGDAVLKVRPPEKKEAAGPNPHAKRPPSPHDKTPPPAAPQP